MLFEQRLEFIESLPSLAVPKPRFTAFSDVPATQTLKPPHDINKPTASAMPDTIDAFLPGVSDQVISDVNLCKLVMNNAATKLYPNDSQLFEWYKYYVDSLNKLGWVTQSKHIQEVTIRKAALTMDQVALEIATGLIGANAAHVLANVARQAVSAVQNNPGAIEIFNRNKKLGSQAKFDIAPVWVDAYGQPNMVLNCISLDVRESSRGILFWKSTTQSTTVKSGAVRSYLDTKVFSGLRDSLYTRFAETGNKFIIDLPDLDF